MLYSEERKILDGLNLVALHGTAGIHNAEDAVSILKSKIKNYDPTGVDGECIVELIVMSHNASAGQVMIGDTIADYKWTYNDHAPLQKAFLDTVKSLLCCDAVVEFRECYAGGGERGDLLGEFLADYLDSTVILYEGIVSPWGDGSLTPYPFKQKIFHPTPVLTIF